MNGMILSHAINLADHIRNHSELIEIKIVRMNDRNLNLHYRAQAGKDFLLLCKERIEYRKELEEILNHYLSQAIEDLLYECWSL